MEDLLPDAFGLTIDCAAQAVCGDCSTGCDYLQAICHQSNIGSQLLNSKVLDDELPRKRFPIDQCLDNPDFVIDDAIGAVLNKIFREKRLAQFPRAAHVGGIDAGLKGKEKGVIFF